MMVPRCFRIWKAVLRRQIIDFVSAVPNEAFYLSTDQWRKTMPTISDILRTEKNTLWIIWTPANYAES